MDRKTKLSNMSIIRTLILIKIRIGLSIKDSLVMIRKTDLVPCILLMGISSVDALLMIIFRVLDHFI